MRTVEEIEKKKSAKGRKTLVVFGIIFLIAGIFLVSFACSFQVLIQSAQAGPDEGTMAAENQKLREENQLLQDRISILESEIEAGNPEPSSVVSSSAPSATSSSAAGSAASAKPSKTAKPTATATKTPKPSATKTAKPTQTATSNSTLVE